MVAVTNDLGRNRPRFAFGSIRSFFGGKSNTAKSNRNDPEVVCFRNHSSGSFVQKKNGKFEYAPSPEAYSELDGGLIAQRFLEHLEQLANGTFFAESDASSGCVDVGVQTSAEFVGAALSVEPLQPELPGCVDVGVQTSVEFVGPEIGPAHPDTDADSCLVNARDIVVVRRLGEGSFGEVCLCKCTTFGAVAVKFVKPSAACQRHWSCFYQEAGLMSKLNHPNVVRFYGLAVADGGCGRLPVGMITEFLSGGSLAAFLAKRISVDAFGRRQREFLSLWERAYLALGAASGLAYLHANGIVHYDVKSENFLVEGGWHSPGGPVVKIADFGLSKSLSDPATRRDGLNPWRGTVPYMAPEVAGGFGEGKIEVSAAADVWSLGIFFWEMLTLEAPYHGVDGARLEFIVQSGHVQLEIPHWCEPEWLEIMMCCCERDPSLRPTCRDLADMLQGILDPEC